MKATGFVRRLDEVGRLMIPVKVRKTLKIEGKTELEIYTVGNGIILQKFIPLQSCIFCQSTDNLIAFKHRHVCKKCIAILNMTL